MVIHNESDYKITLARVDSLCGPRMGAYEVLRNILSGFCRSQSCFVMLCRAFVGGDYIV